ncbi:hypothetical protein WJX81_004619 [Elliptochloris bilobata]|uniref:PROP1-like PPR domain-containing protein n=1 Tax=Elliptochloris bilobata TaxID=381761 RepID=A0AAW1RC98_9CHLO
MPHKPRTGAMHATATTSTASRVQPEPRRGKLVNYLGLAVLALRDRESPGAVLEGQALSNREITKLLTYLGVRKAPERALAVFNWLDAQPDFSTGDAYHYVALMSAFTRRGGSSNAAQALALFDRMLRAGVAPDLFSFNAAISAAGKAGAWERALALLGQMRERGVQPDVVTFSSLIAACQACGGRWQAALALLDQMQAEGVAPNVQTYTAVIIVLAHAGQAERAMQMFRRMEIADVRADLVAYNAIMTAHARGGHWEQAWAVLSAMRAAGVAPNTRSYNALVAACDRGGQPERALEVLRRMQRAAEDMNGHVAPTLVTYNSAISACAKAGMWAEARGLADAMAAARIAPDMFTLSALVAAADAAGQWRAAVEEVERFRAAGGRPNTVAYNALMKALARHGEWRAALRLFNRMRAGTGQASAHSQPGRAPPGNNNPGEGFMAHNQLGPRAEPGGLNKGGTTDPSRVPPPQGALGTDAPPDGVSYTLAAAICTRNQLWQQVLDLHRESEAAGLRATPRMLECVLTAAEQLSLWSKADQAWRELQADGDAQVVDPLAAATRRVVYALPAQVAAPLVASAHAAINSGRAARRWISRGPGEGYYEAAPGDLEDEID